MSFTISGLTVSSLLFPDVCEYFQRQLTHKWWATAAIVGRAAFYAGSGALWRASRWLRLGMIPLLQLHHDDIQAWMNQESWPLDLDAARECYYLWLLQSTAVGLEFSSHLSFQPTLAPWHPWQLPTTAFLLTAPVLLVDRVAFIDTFAFKAGLLSALGFTFGYSLGCGRVTTAIVHAGIAVPCVALLTMNQQQRDKQHAPLAVLHASLAAFVCGCYLPTGWRAHVHVP
eukprot:TRINITY_DN12032_c0_g1_i1.p3 TRINITY_DN12032_c0_g1~~TRINITY_DN12032_c0_g1_i1.p3  ORF type:complete len:228 (+),score=21.84 TRINITY_DN12032_c0_g1_i1:3174-3857(+)